MDRVTFLVVGLLAALPALGCRAGDAGAKAQAGDSSAASSPAENAAASAAVQPVAYVPPADENSATDAQAPTATPLATSPGKPPRIAGDVPPVDDLSGEIWPLELEDARELALQNNKSIAVLGFVPRITATDILREWGAFDPVLGFNTGWVKSDRQVANRIDSFGTSSTTQLQESLRPGDLNSVYLQQKIDTGGTLEVGHSLEYLRLRPIDASVIVNPAYRSALNFGLEQPLFKGRGREVTRAPLAIARANRNQAWHLFEADVRTVLRDVELAYWDVYRAERDMVTRQRVVDQARLTFDRERERLRVGEGSVPDVAQAEEQYEKFRIEMATAENDRRRAARLLQQRMGLAPDDRRRIKIVSEPRDDLPPVDWDAALTYAQARPEVIAQYAAIEAAEMDLVRARNGLEPDVSVIANYAVTGLADRYDDSWQMVGDNKFNDWTVGMVYRQPLGRRAECAALQRAQYAVSRERARLAEVEHDIFHELYDVRRELRYQHDVVTMHLRRLKAASLTLEARRALYADRRATLESQLDAEERSSLAAMDATLALVDYQKALVRWNFVSGALIGGDVVIDERAGMEPR